MRALFADLSEAVDTGLIIAQRCAYMPTKRATSILPYDTDGGRDEDEELRAQARAGLVARLAARFHPGYGRGGVRGGERTLSRASRDGAGHYHRDGVSRLLDRRRFYPVG